jgi:hypothetical protein
MGHRVLHEPKNLGSKDVSNDMKLSGSTMAAAILDGLASWLGGGDIRLEDGGWEYETKVDNVI